MYFSKNCPRQAFPSGCGDIYKGHYLSFTLSLWDKGGHGDAKAWCWCPQLQFLELLS